MTKENTVGVIMRKYTDEDCIIHVDPLLIFQNCEMAQYYVDSLNFQKDKLNKILNVVTDDNPYKPLEFIGSMLEEAIRWEDTLQPKTEFYIMEVKTETRTI